MNTHNLGKQANQSGINSPETLTLAGQGIFDEVFHDRFEPPD